ncbi:MAG: lysophospholipid acyltransferase family protein [Candidatus Thermoplasmatota archaeon]|nr:lysophospholipid acyltransferase family protein [Candidatus Thermoplasmatota archaeon]
MHFTIYDIPMLRPFLKWCSRALLKLTGWKIDDFRNGEKKLIAIAAPHTSNWDFPFFISYAFALDFKSYWMGKHTLFKKPFRGFFRFLGGLPIDRTKRANTVGQIVSHFSNLDELAVTIAPEGTRKAVERWKTGFYYMAVGANVPIALCFLDYKKKIGGIGKMLYPTGDIDRDLIEIMGFYRDVTPRYPGNFKIQKKSPSSL